MVENELEHVKFPKISVETPFEIFIDPHTGPVKIIAEKSHVVESLTMEDFEKKKNAIGLKPEIKRKRPGRPAAYPKLEEHLKNWVGESSENLKALSAKSQKKQIKEKAKEIALDLDISAFGATDIWLKNFITKRCDELKKSLKNITFGARQTSELDLFGPANRNSKFSTFILLRCKSNFQIFELDLLAVQIVFFNF